MDDDIASGVCTGMWMFIVSASMSSIVVNVNDAFSNIRIFPTVHIVR